MDYFEKYKNYQAGYVTIIGRPNCGKSTLMNTLLDFKISIVTHKPQTTRQNILGILSGDNFQIIFMVYFMKTTIKNQIINYIFQYSTPEVVVQF